MADLEINPHLFKQMLDSSGVVMSIRDKELRPIFVNQAFTDFYGYTVEEMRKIPIVDILPEETYALYTQTILPTVKSGKSWEGEHTLRTQKGRLCPVWTRFDPVLDKEGNLTHAISIMRDASDSMRLRNALTQTERHLHFLAENSSDCLFRLRLTDWRWDYVSSAIQSITGYKPQDFYNTPMLFKSLIPEDWTETYELWWSEFHKGESRYEYESPLLHRDGSKKWVNQRITVVKEHDGTPIAIEGIITDVTERRKAQEELATTQSSLNFISNSTSDIFFKITIPEGRYEYISPSVQQFSGYTHAEYLENPFLIRDIIHPDWLDYFAEAWTEHLKGIVRPDYEFQFIHKSGDIRWASQRLIMHKDVNGTPIAVEGMVTDITRHKRAETALKESEQQYRFLAENITDVVWTMDAAFTFTYATPSVEIMWGYTKEELAALDMRTLFTPEALITFGHAQKLRAEAEAKGDFGHVNRLEMEHITKDGTFIWAETVIRRTFTEDGTPAGYQGISRDITERRKAEQALKGSEQQYRMLAESITDVVWTLSNDLVFTFATPSVINLWGYTVDEFLEIEFPQLFTPTAMAEIRQAMETRKEAEANGDFEHVNRLELEHYRKDGSTIWAESVIRRLYNEKNEPLGYQGVSRDMSERKHAEASVMESEARFRTLFEDSPISLWEEDLTRLKAYFDELKAEGVEDFRKYFYDNPVELGKCAQLVDVVGVNKATLELLKAKNKDDLLGNLDKVLTESSMAAFTEEMILLASGGCEYCGEITHRTLEGDIIWVVVHFFVPPEYQDTLSRVIVSLIDVTPRKRAEQALMESEERYRVLVENAQEGVVVFKDDCSLFINEGMTNIFGYSADELRKLPPLEMVHPEDKSKAMELFGDLTPGTKRDGVASFRVYTKDKKTKWLTMTVKPIIWGGEDAQLKILTDVTIHKELEAELKLAHTDMENRIETRTAELLEANVQLITEAEEREKAQGHIMSLTQQLIRIQEDERQRIARDLHDNVAQDLSSIVINMETLFDGHALIEPQVRQRSDAVAEVVRGAIASVRDIAYGLRPPALDQLGLTLAIKRLCEETSSRTGVDIEFFAIGIDNLSLDFDSEINIYRMVQEAIGNMGKHAKATKATVRLIKSHPNLLVRVEDNGRGFLVEKRRAEALEEKRMGLRSMEERARLIGGSMEIQSLVDSGTRIIFTIPITDARRQ